jgi:hypothetical protein
MQKPPHTLREYGVNLFLAFLGFKELQTSVITFFAASKLVGCRASSLTLGLVAKNLTSTLSIFSKQKQRKCRECLQETAL